MTTTTRSAAALPADMPADTVFIRGLQISTTIGVHAWERVGERPLLLDLELDTDLRKAAASDALADAIDYAAVVARVRDIAHELKPALLETLAETLAVRLLAELAVNAVRITVHKPGAVPGTASVGVKITRQR